ncbi:GDP-mannose 4,6-dehydratase [Luteimonas sp. SX5]|uniref:GDP-mannose 4,6-dehydratase n=1 Tax=Luteimonas galliterrae TaxID=2940486 RepID=A0ABT0MID0_9GAMM|nr:GDP-mannose 4,6-dehydratase [Luteimonas galliterrae]MCL1634637.1 GDP-mannose 4,6-dehydratase [Luteimonas galliterrae]
MLVTGAHGFVGGHVAAAVRAGVYGSDAQFLAAPEGLDIRDEAGLAALIEESKPDSVLHLAAQSFVPRSFENPRETFEINAIGTLNLLVALKRSGFAGRFVYASSGDVYGRVPESELPVSESRIPEPLSPYAASKIAAEQLCLQWHRSEGWDAIVARPFNHIGPGQDARFVVPALARQVVAIASGKRPPVVDAGDIDTTRDFTDVRDIAAAYASILRHGRPGRIYVVGSGQERKVRDLLWTMCELAGIKAEVRQDPAKLRPTEQRRMAADASLLREDTGWSPSITIETTLSDILKYTRTHP